MFDKILAATDGTEISTRATEIAADLAGMYGARLILLRVLSEGAQEEGLRELARAEHLTAHRQIDRQIVAESTWHGPLYVTLGSTETADAGALRKMVEMQLEHEAHTLASGRSVSEIVPILTVGDPGKTILEVSRQHSVDAIVMGSGEHSGLLDTLLGRSVSNKVLSNAECTCVIVR